MTVAVLDLRYYPFENHGLLSVQKSEDKKEFD